MLRAERRIDWDRHSLSAAGISTESVSSAISFIESHRIPIHSLIVIHGSTVGIEAYWHPYSVDKLHRMFSVTKSFVSLAVGVLVSRKIISLDSHVADFFPELIGNDNPKEIRYVTIKDMLSMKTCHIRASHKTIANSNYVGSYSDDWVGSFFKRCDDDHHPGTIFSYDDTAAAVVGAIVERVSGKDLMSFMKETFLAETGISENAYIMKMKTGVSMGNSGLMATPRDLAVIMRFIQDRAFDSIASSYIDEALSLQSDTDIGNADYATDFRNGYGYYFWLIRNGGWAMYGNGGQLAICVPGKDVIMIANADTQTIKGGTQVLMDALWMIAEGTSNSFSESPEVMSRGDGCRMFSLLHESGVGVLPFDIDRSFACAQNKLGISSLRVSIDSSDGILDILKDDGDRISIVFGIEHNAESTASGLPVSLVVASGAWKSDGTLSVMAYFLGEEIGSLAVQLAIKGDRISAMFRLFGELSFAGFDGTVDGEEI